MFNRLVAENTIKTPFKGEPFFSVNRKMIAYQTDNTIRIKSLNRETKEIVLQFTHPIIAFELSTQRTWLYVLTTKQVVEIYCLEFVLGVLDGQYKKVGLINNVTFFKEIKEALVVECTNKTIKVITLEEVILKTVENLNIDMGDFVSLTENKENGVTIFSSKDNERVFIGKGENKSSITSIELYERKNKNSYEKTLEMTYLSKIMAIYKGKYVFQMSGESTAKK